MTQRLLRIDELTRPDHTYLLEEDECYYLREYIAGGGYSISATNDLILNLKKPMARRDLAEYRYKRLAIEQAGYEFKSAINADFLRSATLVPMPPSRSKSDPDYDDRILQVIDVMVRDIDADVRELIVQTQSLPPHHGGSSRNPHALARYYLVDPALMDPEPTLIAIFDDVLTTGSHFRAAKHVLIGAFPNAHVVGIFVSRRLPWSADI